MAIHAIEQEGIGYCGVIAHKRVDPRATPCRAADADERQPIIAFAAGKLVKAA
nr:hypothetical protein [Sinorhizobium medicae]